MADHLIRGLLAKGGPRVVAAVTTDLCAEACRRHGVDHGAADALARSLTAAALMATLTKDRERITVKILGSGPLRTLTAEAYADGSVRGYPAFCTDSPRNLSSTVKDLIGEAGKVTVLRDLGLKEIYEGHCSIVSGEIDLDLEHYLSTSEQIPSVLRCQTLLDSSGRIKAACGILVQHVPDDQGSLDSIRDKMDRNLLEEFMTSKSKHHLAACDDLDGAPLRLAAKTLLRPLKPEQLDLMEWRSLAFRCGCTTESAARALFACGIEEVKKMIEEGSASATCHYCNHTFEFTGTELKEMLERHRPC